MKTETILHPEKAQVRPALTARADGSQAVIEAGAFSWRADLPDVRATVRCRTDFRGLLGVDGAPPDLEGFELGSEIISPDERGAHSVYQAWLERCLVYLALAKPTPIATTVEIKRG